MQAVSPLAAVFGSMADSLAKQAEEKRRMKMMDYQNQLAIQRMNEQIKGQEELNRQAIVGQTLSKIATNPKEYSPETIQEAGQGLKAGIEGNAFNMPENIQMRQQEKVPLQPKIARFFGVPENQEYSPEDAAQLGWRYRTFWQNYQKANPSDRFVNIHGSKVNKSTLLQYLSRWGAMVIQNLQKGVPTGIGANGPQVTNFPTEAAQSLLNRTNQIIDKLVLNKKLTRDDISFIENLKNPVGQGLEYYNQLKDIGNPKSQTSQDMFNRIGQAGATLQSILQQLGKK